MRYSPHAERRRRRIAARKPNRWLTEPCPPADQEILEYADWRMSIVDGMSPQWRALVSYYGFQKTNELYASGMDPSVAWHTLEVLRRGAQEAQLRTDYFLKGERLFKRIVL